MNEDEAYAQTREFKNRLDEARRRVAEALRRESKWSVSFSGGKDSLCVLSLVREQCPDVPVVFVDSGMEYPETLAFVERMEKEWGLDLLIVEPEPNLLRLIEESGVWDWNVNGRLSEATMMRVLVHTPFRRARAELGTEGSFIGLREEESAARLFNLRRRGWIYYCERSAELHCHPISHWKTRDVWAYIASRNLPFNPVYGKLTAAGVPRERQRCGAVMGGTSIGSGRWASLRKTHPEMFNRLAARFPRLREFV
jgi:phosphoadenosine phosphosulfate reductase